MGDCRLLFRIHWSLCSFDESGNSSSNSGDALSSLRSFSKVFSADTTIREVFDETTLKDAIDKDKEEDDKNNNNHHHHHDKDAAGMAQEISLRSLMRGTAKARLWDCTKHPPRDITDWPLHTFSAIKGSKSKTLYDAGWFPSGTLSLLPPGQTPKVASMELDIQFNVVQQPPKQLALSADNNKEPHQANNRLKPSQVMQQAKNRFEDDSTISTTSTETSKTQRMLRQRREANRKRHLEECLKKLDHNNNNTDNKNRNVSSQVRKMLIKSRATGRANLAVPDRVYLHCIVLDETDDDGDDHENDKEPRQEFCYFSRQDTVGRVLESFPVPKGTQMEFLIQANPPQSEENDNDEHGEEEDSVEYAKLPSLMRLYEAIENGYLTQADNKVVLRIYNPTRQNPTVVVHRQRQQQQSRNNLIETKIDPIATEDPPDKRQPSTRDPPDSSLDPKDPAPSGKDPPDAVGKPAADDPMDQELTPKPKRSDEGHDQLAPALSSDTTESSRTSASAYSTRSDPSGLKDQNTVADVELSRNTPTIVSPRLVQAIREAEQQGVGASTKKKKPTTKAKAATSAAARKVRQMQIKSKAVGDDKRVRATARFHFEAIVVTLDPLSNRFVVERITPHFLANTDMLSRVTRDYYASYSFSSPPDPKKGTTVERWDYVVLPAHMDSDEDDLHRILDPSQALKDLQSRSLLQPFDKVILMPLFSK